MSSAACTRLARTDGWFFLLFCLSMSYRVTRDVPRNVSRSEIVTKKRQPPNSERGRAVRGLSILARESRPVTRESRHSMGGFLSGNNSRPSYLRRFFNRFNCFLSPSLARIIPSAVKASGSFKFNESFVLPISYSFCSSFFTDLSALSRRSASPHTGFIEFQCKFKARFRYFARSTSSHCKCLS